MLTKWQSSSTAMRPHSFIPNLRQEPGPCLPLKAELPPGQQCYHGQLSARFQRPAIHPLHIASFSAHHHRSVSSQPSSISVTAITHYAIPSACQLKGSSPLREPCLLPYPSRCLCGLSSESDLELGAPFHWGMDL